jgi:hypothetical protein
MFFVVVSASHCLETSFKMETSPAMSAEARLTSVIHDIEAFLLVSERVKLFFKYFPLTNQQNLGIWFEKAINVWFARLPQEGNKNLKYSTRSTEVFGDGIIMTALKSLTHEVEKLENPTPVQKRLVVESYRQMLLLLALLDDINQIVRANVFQCFLNITIAATDEELLKEVRLVRALFYSGISQLSKIDLKSLSEPRYIEYLNMLEELKFRLFNILVQYATPRIDEFKAKTDLNKLFPFVLNLVSNPVFFGGIECCQNIEIHMKDLKDAYFAADYQREKESQSLDSSVEESTLEDIVVRKLDKRDEKYFY